MRGLALWLLAATAVAGTWKAVLAPGPLATPHDAWLGDCDVCHLAFDGIPDERCLSCHEALAAKISGGEGFHAAQSERCIACHTDHHGLGASLTREAALAAFEHAETGFDLHGAHQRVRCDTCHDAPLGEMEVACGGCHLDPHTSALGPACEDCHQPVAWDHQVKTLQAHQVSTNGGHQGLGCEDCHTHGAHLQDPVLCNDCHSDAHGGTRSPCDQCHQVGGWTPATFDHGPCTCAFPGKHQTVGCLDCHANFVFADTPTACAGCHASDRPHEDLGGCAACHDAVSWTENRFDHNRGTSFRIEGAHNAVSCVQCHTTPGVFLGAPTTCEGCHAAAGAPRHGDFGACAPCHTVEGFTPSTFDHAGTGFPLAGAHLGIGCPDCHAEKVKGFPGGAP